MVVLLARHPLGGGSTASILPRSTNTIVGVAALLDDARDDVALLAGELAEPDVVLGVAQPLQDDLLGGRGGDPAEASGVSSHSRDDLALLVALRGLHRHVAGLAVELDPRVLVRAGCAVVGDQQRLLDGVDEHVERDLLLADERAQHGSCRCP